MKILIAGDFCPKHRTAELLEQGRYEEMLGEVKPIIEQADYSIVNFECPVVNGKGNPIPKCGPNLRTTEKAVDLIKYAGFKAVTLANNHFLDYGEEGVSDTLEALDKAGIAHVGGGMNLDEASKTMYIDGGAGKVAIINCCEHEFSIATDTTAGSNPLNSVQQWYAIQDAKKQADYVIVIVHGGHEHYQLPSPRMVELYRYFIDCGADAVVNHHQLCYSGYEYYNDKPIVYGLGNFCFDYENRNKGIWTEGYMVELTLTKTVEYKLIPYIQCADKATVTLMQGDNLRNFKNTINKLSAIIADDIKLRKEHKNFLNQTSKIYEFSLSPITNRFLRAAVAREWLPMFLNKKKLVILLNYIDCESHRERLLSVLKNKI